ncbi:transcription factor Iws1 [Pseudohyphozyma bogoriensis]|nr:transcription factor Iws1 [Pseudohyphozyma bogoriensis]
MSSPPAANVADIFDDDDNVEDRPAPAAPEQVNIFGGDDSDLSDLDDEPGATSPGPERSASPQSARDAGADEDDEDEDEQQYNQDEDDAMDGEYDAETAGAKLKKMKIKKKVRREEDGEEAVPKRSRKKEKKKEKQPVEEEEEEVDPETARRRALDARLDALVKKPKNRSGMSRKRKNLQDDDLEAFNDEMVVRLRMDMLAAAEKDVDENEAGRFAVNKLRMLQEVVDAMQKSSLAESLVENGVLEAVKRWLEPLPDKSLPALAIQRHLFEILRNLPIETSALKSSGVGKIVYFYTKCKRVEPQIARMASQLVSDWMRPIIRRSKAFTDKLQEEDEDDEPRNYRPNAGRATNEDIARRHARIPEMLTTQYKIAPESDPKDRSGGSGMQASHASTGMSSKMRSYKKKLIASQAASRRV